MREDDLKQYIENTKKINELLAQNEDIIRSAGYQPPTLNYAAAKDDRIRIPSGYIRTSAQFWKLYHLDVIAIDRNTKNNISYALQLSDYYNFLMNRINIWGSIEIMLYKQAFVNLVSIIEALVLECANNINANCKACTKIGRCKNNINKEERDNAKKAIEKLYALNVLRVSDDEKKRLIELYDLRNKVHIRLTTQNEFLSQNYNNDLYNETILLLQKIDDSIWKYGVPYYARCMGFENK